MVYPNELQGGINNLPGAVNDLMLVVPISTLHHASIVLYQIRRCIPTISKQTLQSVTWHSSESTVAKISSVVAFRRSNRRTNFLLMPSNDKETGQTANSTSKRLVLTPPCLIPPSNKAGQQPINATKTAVDTFLRKSDRSFLQYIQRPSEEFRPESSVFDNGAEITRGVRNNL